MANDTASGQPARELEVFLVHPLDLPRLALCALSGDYQAERVMRFCTDDAEVAADCAHCGREIKGHKHSRAVGLPIEDEASPGWAFFFCQYCAPTRATLERRAREACREIPGFIKTMAIGPGLRA